MNEPAVACRLDAFTAAERARYETLRQSLFARVRSTKELPDGWSFELPDSDRTIRDAAEFITLERRCCPFFRFTLESGGKAVSFSITGPPAAKELLRPSAR